MPEDLPQTTFHQNKHTTDKRKTICSLNCCQRYLLKMMMMMMSLMMMVLFQEEVLRVHYRHHVLRKMPPLYSAEQFYSNPIRSKSGRESAGQFPLYFMTRISLVLLSTILLRHQENEKCVQVVLYLIMLSIKICKIVEPSTHPASPGLEIQIIQRNDGCISCQGLNGEPFRS